MAAIGETVENIVQEVRAANIGAACGEILGSHPDMTVLDLASAAVARHIAVEGCQFRDDAARRAVADLGLRTSALAAALPKGVIAALGQALEEQEVSCARRALPQPARVA